MAQIAIGRLQREDRAATTRAKRRSNYSDYFVINRDAKRQRLGESRFVAEHLSAPGCSNRCLFENPKVSRKETCNLLPIVTSRARYKGEILSNKGSSGGLHPPPSSSSHRFLPSGKQRRRIEDKNALSGKREIGKVSRGFSRAVARLRFRMWIDLYEMISSKISDKYLRRYLTSRKSNGHFSSIKRSIISNFHKHKLSRDTTREQLRLSTSKRRTRKTKIHRFCLHWYETRTTRSTR